MLYSAGKLVNLAPAGQALSYAVGINKSGQVVGYYATLGNQYSAFIWTPNQPNGTTGKMTTVKNQLDGTYSLGAAINDSGQIVGTASLANNYVAGWPDLSFNAGHAFLYSGGKTTDLGTLPTAKGSTATGINSSGTIVGYACCGTHVGQRRAVIYTSSGPVDLNTLIPAGSGWLLLQANGINDAGQDCGYRPGSITTPALFF